MAIDSLITIDRSSRTGCGYFHLLCSKNRASR